MVIIIKPTHLCNLRCKYCFVGDKRQEKDIMSLDFAKLIISKIKTYLISKKHKNVKFVWHGGEPLLWGHDNYHNILEFCEKEFADFKIKHTMQTNLTLLDQEYIDIFKKYDVKLGFSMDGFGKYNDITRIKADGTGSFDTIFDKYKLCKKNGLRPGAIIVLTKFNKDYIKEIYHFYSQNKIHFKLNPVFNFGAAEDCYSKLGVTVDEYAKAMIDLFDLWIDDMETGIEITNLKEIASNIITRKTSLCTLKKNCQFNFISIAPNGDVYPCGRFHADSKYVIGNISTDSMENIMETKQNSVIQNRHLFIEKSDCSKCKYLDICYGGCVHDAIIAYGSPNNKTGLCKAYKLIFSHIEDVIKHKLPKQHFTN